MIQGIINKFYNEGETNHRNSILLNIQIALNQYRCKHNKTDKHEKIYKEYVQ